MVTEIHKMSSNKTTRFRFKASEDEMVLETLIRVLQDGVQGSLRDFWNTILLNLRLENERFHECSLRTLQEHTLPLICGHRSFRSKELNKSGKEYEKTTKCILLDDLLALWENYEKLEKDKRKYKSRNNVSQLPEPQDSDGIVAMHINEASFNGNFPIIIEGTDESNTSFANESPMPSSSEEPCMKRLKVDQGSYEYLHRTKLDSGLDYSQRNKIDPGLDYLQKKLDIDRELEEKRLALENRRLDLQERQLAIEESRWEKERGLQKLMAEMMMKMLDKLK